MLVVVVLVILFSLLFVMKFGVKWIFIDVFFILVSVVSVMGLFVIMILDMFIIVGIIVLVFIL